VKLRAFLSIHAVLLGGIAALHAVDQTPTFDPVTAWGGDYTIDVERYAFSPTTPAGIPTLQSYAAGVYNGQWVLVSGRTNGLHGFSNDGVANFPPAFQNSSVWVVDPVTQQTWTKSYSDMSGLDQATIDSLSATNTQFFQHNDTLFVSGGYVYDSINDDFTTYNRLTALDLPDLVNWVKTDNASLATNAVLHVEGRATPGGDGGDDFFAVTGGGMHRFDENGRVALTFGQNFEGGYTVGSNGEYTSQVRTFDIVYDKDNGTLDYSNEAATPEGGDPRQFRRRDLNVARALVDDPENPGETKEILIAYSGVFYKDQDDPEDLGFGIWTIPVEIGSDGVPAMKAASDPDAFYQGMQQYHSGKVGMYSAETGEFTQLLFGGITANEYVEGSSPTNLVYDGFLPFTTQISSIVRSADGTFEQFYLGDFPAFNDGSGDPVEPYFGANSEFFVAEGVPLLADGVIDFDALEGETLLGYLYGGIKAEQPNFGPTSATGEIFTVIYRPIPEPASGTLLALGALGLLARRARRSAR